MVKLKGPLGSAEASGSFGPSTTFSSWKGRAYAKTKTVPTNPNSPAQISVRAMLGFLAAQWTELTAPDKATWETLAAQSAIPPYNAFIRTNLERWTQFNGPTKIPTDTSPQTQPAASLTSAQGGTGQVLLTLTMTTLYKAWGVVIFHGPNVTLTPSNKNAIVFIPVTATGPFTWTHHGLVPGTYRYNARYFTVGGSLGTNETGKTATVT